MTMYRISQLAERSGVPATTLRFYEQAGLLPARRSQSGYRLYDETAVDRLDFISSGKRLGLALEEIRELLDVWQDGMCTDVRTQLRLLLLAHVDEATRSAAALDAFTDRLRKALGEIEGPEQPGRCGPGCGFLPVEQIACTLTGTDQGARIARWRELLDGASREHIDGGLRFGLDMSLAGPVAELAAAEQQCCAFFGFTLRLTSAGLQLEVRAPAEAAPVLADVFG